MKDDFDTAAFYAALNSQRGEKKMSWKDVAAATGVNASTLTRMAQDKLPDAKGMAALFAWSGFGANDFMHGPRFTTNPIGVEYDPDAWIARTAVPSVTK